MRTIADIQTEFLVRGGLATTASGLVTDTILNSFTRAAHIWAAASKKWPFTEGRISTTYASVEEWNFEGYKSDSFRFITIGDKRLQKLNFEDYQIMKEEDLNRGGIRARFYSDFGGLVYIDPRLDLSGTLIAYGQFTPVLDPTDKDALTVFTNYDTEGNEAIVNEMLSYLKVREKKPQEANNYHQLAVNHIENLAKRIGQEQFAYQSTNRGMFSRMDVIDGMHMSDEVRRDRF